MKTRLIEHDFFQIRNRIYRVFGYEHPHGKYYGLLRYWRENPNSSWIKPPVNGAERGAQDVLNLYNCKLVTCEPYGLELGLFKTEDIEKVFRSTNPNCSKNSIAVETLSIIRKYSKNYCNKNKCVIQTGLVGSHLVGIANSSSDIDIVFYGIIGEEKARSFVKPLLNKIRDNIDYMYTGVPGKSISDTRTFIQKSGINNLSETDRALFGTYSLGRKLDIYYVRDIDTLTTINPISTRVTSAPSLFAGKILKSDDRIYYPPILTIEINDQEKEVIFLNHEAKFLIKGDVVKFRAVEKIIENSVSNNWNQGDTVMLATDLINCHPTNK